MLRSTSPLTRGQQIFCALFLLPFVVLLFWLLAERVADVAHWRSSSSWTPVQATVESVRALDCGRGGTMPEVRYRYAVPPGAGAAQRSDDHFMFGGAECGDREEALAVLRQYRPGTPVTVYVDPADTARSVLLRDVSGRTWFELAMATVAGLSLLALVVAWLVGARTDA